MQTPENNPSFRQALDLLSRGVDAQALSLLTGLGQETGEAGASRLARLFCLALLGEWSELERASASWPFGPLQTVSALRALSLAKMEPSEEALRLALDSAWLPSRPIPEPGDEALWRLWTLWEGPLSARLLRVQLGRQGESLAREAPRPSGGGRDHEAAEAEASDPFLEAILALLDPLPGRARSLLGGAVEIGLDLAPARLALARLHRRAHDRDGARAILRRIPGETLEAPWQERLAKEIEACARDSELQRATKVRLERGPDSRVLRRARGVLLSIETKGQTWTRPVESEPLGAALAGMVSDHLAAAWVLADWTLAEGDTDMHEGLDEALERRDYPRALSLGRRLMSSRPDDAALAARVLAAAVNLREPQGAIELSQRAVVLTEEAPSALRRHAALLFAAGTV
ncbi:MAG: hypothetical protein RBU30_19360, partial [Polyangia bacterium]|nr:hypothetical protein [Polyangia bacterium]